jgi:para-aminobenzoate synthetase component 1
MLNWAKQFNIFCFLDNQQYTIAPHQYECLLAAGATDFVQAGTHSLQHVDHFTSDSTWVFGHLSYELKQTLFNLSTSKEDLVGFPLFYFFKPVHLLYISNGSLYIESNDAYGVFKELMETPVATTAAAAYNISIQQRLTRQQYLQTIQQLQQHILRGDCYEINFCQEFFAENAIIDPVTVFEKLVQLSPSPFAALYRVNDQYLICASPERFLGKKGAKIFSQPIKGTAGRSTDTAEDELLKQGLQTSQKERSENVMVVDLVRNDLSKICTEGSVKVDELYGIYTFPHVHQMISTISGELKENVTFSHIIQATFPMGSMTGAPKHRVMQLIDAYEPVSRGLFSGSVGYIAPNGDFDFNVVIRSLLYNAATQYLSYQAGSGITFYSHAEAEWEECLLKGAAIKKVLTS